MLILQTSVPYKYKVTSICVFITLFVFQRSQYTDNVKRNPTSFVQNDVLFDSMCVFEWEEIHV